MHCYILHLEETFLFQSQVFVILRHFNLLLLVCSVARIIILTVRGVVLILCLR